MLAVNAKAVDVVTATILEAGQSGAMVGLFCGEDERNRYLSTPAVYHS